MTNEMYDKLLPLDILQDGYNIMFSNLDLFIKYIQLIKSMSSELLHANLHLLTDDNDYKYLFDNIKIKINYTLDFIPKKNICKELVKRYTFTNEPKLFEYFDMFPTLYKNCNIINYIEPKYYSSNDSNIIIEFDTTDIRTNLTCITNILNMRLSTGRYIYENLYVPIKAYLIKYIHNKYNIKDYIDNEFSKVRCKDIIGKRLQCDIIKDIKKYYI